MGLHFERPRSVWIWPTAREGELVPDYPPPVDITPDVRSIQLGEARVPTARSAHGSGAYTVGWLVAVVSLYGAHELDGHWLGWVAAFVGYGAGLAWVRRVRPHPSRE